MDALSITGLLLGFAAIVGGQYLEGGQVSSLFNGGAFIIVVGGALGAILLQTPLLICKRALKISAWVFKPPIYSMDKGIDKLVYWSQIARKEGLLALEPLVSSETDDFARKGLQMVVDGNEVETIRSVLELHLEANDQVDLQAAKVFDDIGGYCPTIGIIGAVLGLIQVMGNLADPARLGEGIAVAFVATIYGVGLANLLFIPIGNKLSTLIEVRAIFRELVIEGLVAIAEGENPRLVEVRLSAYL